MKTPPTHARAARAAGLRRDAHGADEAAAGAESDIAERRNRRLALVALGVMAVVWGYNWVVMKESMAYIGAFDFIALRNLFGALFLVLLLIALRYPLRIRAWRKVVLLGLLQTAAFSALIQVALLQGGVGKTSFLVYTMPFWAIPMAWLAFGERIRGLQWAALVLAAGGLVFILEPWRAHGSVLSEMLALSAGLCWALAMIVTKWVRRTEGIAALPLATWQMLFGALVLCVAAWLIPQQPIEPSPYLIGALVYNAVPATAIAWFLWIFAVQYLSAAAAGMAALGVPIVSVVSGWLELGERPAPAELTGMVLIATALIVLSLRSVSRRR